jgi:hypothetical protein
MLLPTKDPSLLIPSDLMSLIAASIAFTYPHLAIVVLSSGHEDVGQLDLTASHFSTRSW